MTAEEWKLVEVGWIQSMIVLLTLFCSQIATTHISQSLDHIFAYSERGTVKAAASFVHQGNVSIGEDAKESLSLVNYIPDSSNILESK